jgi:glycosyltransferase involved in cell wall biosynthesis
MDPLVSIITPFYNSEKYLSATIKSVLSQSYSNWELLLINDGSTDNSIDIVSCFNDSRIKILSQHNKGQCVATNLGINHACGEYFQFLDADDIIHPFKIANQIRDLRHNPNALGVCKWFFFYNDATDAKFSNQPVFFSASPIEWLYQLWTNDTMMATNGYLISRSILERGGMYFNESLKLNVDFEYFTRIVLASKSVIFTDDSFAYYRKGVSSSKTARPSFEAKLSALKARELAISYLLQIEQTDMAKYASNMAISILTFSYPELLYEARALLSKYELGSFIKFGGSRSLFLSGLIGYENYIKLKKNFKKTY